MVKFLPKIRLGMLINIMFIKQKRVIAVGYCDSFFSAPFINIQLDFLPAKNLKIMQ